MLPRELLKRIRKIEIVTQRLVRDRMAGQYHSVFKGRGITFEEVRPYIPGDDVRFIDWNVTARMNEAYVKLFSEEREMTVLLVVDMSASGRFGSRQHEKRERASSGKSGHEKPLLTSLLSRTETLCRVRRPRTFSSRGLSARNLRQGKKRTHVIRQSYLTSSNFLAHELA
jgi:hypothetical protein